MLLCCIRNGYYSVIPLEHIIEKHKAIFPGEHRLQSQRNKQKRFTVMPQRFHTHSKIICSKTESNDLCKRPQFQKRRAEKMIFFKSDVKSP
ncbi:hypothetical protein NPIL_24311 [Nephila pilipes]|uniref:Uncharacterized protein n=1 Tax=Nephila pilipes TaxID=299642 RepID=A0A8X6U2C0_NEPPI|nr:hypothetical protein NPIL_24311 [Nephila pilipes]